MASVLSDHSAISEGTMLEGGVDHLGKGLGACPTTEQAGGAHSSNAAHKDEQPQLAAEALPGRKVRCWTAGIQLSWLQRKAGLFKQSNW